MTTKNKLVRVYTGTEIKVNILKGELEKAGISGIIQNDFNAAISAGFSSGSPSSIDLFIQESDLNKAEPIIKEFVKINEE